MSTSLLWWVGDQNPAYADTITIAGVAVDLTAKTAQFKMRIVGSATLKVNQPVTTKDASGNFTYAWGATDLDTAGQYLVWVEVTTSGKVQTLYESLIEVRAHSNSRVYVELGQLKSTTELTGFSFADQDAQNALVAASRAIDEITGRRFWADADAAQIRYYTPDECGEVVEIDDLITLTALATDLTGGTSFATAWTENTHFFLEPLNAVADGEPWTQIRRHPTGGNYWPYGYPRSIRVTGKFGWAAVPAEIQTATMMIATRLVKRMREAPLGFVTAMGIDGPSALRVARTDPDVGMLLDRFCRKVLAA